MVWSGELEIMKLDMWPAEEIVAIPHTFAVTWEVENPTTRLDMVIQEKMTQLITESEAWRLLHSDHSRLFQESSLNYRAKLKPGQTIRAEIVRRNVEAAVQFEVNGKGQITFIHEIVPTMVT
jgi:hypothetical protein